MKISINILSSLSVALLVSACASGPLGTGDTYDYKRMVIPVTWSESEFKPALMESDTYNDTAKKWRWVRVGGNVIGSGIGGLKAIYGGYAMVKDGLPPINRGDLVEFLTSKTYGVNLDTHAGTSVVIRIVCRKEDKACMSSETEKLKAIGSNVIGTDTREEWAAVARAKRL